MWLVIVILNGMFVIRLGLFKTFVQVRKAKLQPVSGASTSVAAGACIWSSPQEKVCISSLYIELRSVIHHLRLEPDYFSLVVSVWV